MSMQIDYEINKELGECYLFMSEFDKAAEYYRKAVAAAPEIADPYMGLATIAVQRSDLDEALALYAKAASLAPSDKALAGLALVEMEKGRHDDACTHFMAALDVNPGNIFAINGLVQEGYYLDRLEDVVPYLESALGIEDTESLRYALAGCLTALGRNSDARRQLETLLGMNPEHQSAQELYARLAA
jgi:tetratricopeptide (TPR) repeat protein